MIRKQLKANGINARVRSENYSMGSSVDVDINGDYLPAAIEEIKAYCAQFQYGHFDGMTDCYEYSNRNDDLPQAKHVFVRVHRSEELKEAASEFVSQMFGELDSFDQHTQTHQVLNGTSQLASRFWISRKPRVAA